MWGGGCTKCNVGRLHSTAWGHGGIVGTVGTQSQLQPLHIFHAAYLCYFNVFCICIKNLLAPFLVVFAVPPALPPPTLFACSSSLYVARCTWAEVVCFKIKAHNWDLSWNSLCRAAGEEGRAGAHGMKQSPRVAAINKYAADFGIRCQ